MSDVPERIGPYQIIRLLGLGGMAQVYHARKHVEGIDLVVALKVPRQHVVMDPSARRLFLKEAHITTRLGSHPNIVQVLDVGVDGELPYMALEYVTGVDLGRLCSAMIESGTRWSEPAILWVLASIIQALRHAWGAEVAGQPLRIVHRDISPSNVLLTYEGQVKVTDFGISRMAGLDTSGSIRGKARYMPYEQIMGRATAASDLYAVGAIAWELIEGKPFRHDKRTADEMYLATMEGETPSITRTDVSPRLVQLVTRLLHHDLERRIQTPMDAWLELKACPGLNLVDPDPLRMLIEEFLGLHRQSGYTAERIRIHPELVATRAALAAAAAESALPSGSDTEPVTPAPAPAPSMQRPLTDTMKWSRHHPSAAVAWAAEPRWPPVDDAAPPASSHATPPHRARTLGLAAIGLLVGMGLAVAAMKLVGEPADAIAARQAGENQAQEAPERLRGNADDAPPRASAPAVVAVTAEPAKSDVPDPPTHDPANAVEPAPAPASTPVPATPATTTTPPPTVMPEPTASPSTPKPKPAPRATLHVRLDLVPELELRIGSKVRRITGSVTVPAATSIKELAVRTPGSTSWYASRVKLESGREYLVRLHAKRIELIPLDRGLR